MPKTPYAPCIPTRGKTVPAEPDWLHEIKHDGFRLIVQREGKRVRLFTKNGYDWTDRYPLIVEASLRNRVNSFVIDGEAVLLGVDGISDFDGPGFTPARRRSATLCLRRSGDGWRRFAEPSAAPSKEQPRSPTGAPAQRHIRQ